MYDRVEANIPYPITLGDKVLQPGEYRIQQLQSSTGAGRVLLFYTDDGMKFETSALTIPVLDPKTARDTKIILNRVGDDYYIDKIWLEGKQYGYELPMPASLKSRQNEQVSQATVNGKYTPSASTEPTTTAASSATPNNSLNNSATGSTATSGNNTMAGRDTLTGSQTAGINPSTSTETVTPSAAGNTTATNDTVATGTPSTTPTTSVTTSNDTNSADRSAADTTLAQNTPPSPAPSTADSADRSVAPADQTAPANMPNTAANWLLMLMSGGTLSGAGLMLRRKR